MTNFALPPLRLVSFALLGSILVVIGAIIGVLALWQPAPLEAFLPAHGTLAEFHNAAPEDVQPFLSAFPVLQSYPAALTARMDIGVFRRNTGAMAWIATSTTGEEAGSENLRVGRQRFLSSTEDDGLSEELLRRDGRLRSSSSFRTLTRGLAVESSWIFLAAQDSSAVTLPRALRPLTRSSGSLLLARNNGMAMLRVEGQVPLPGENPIEEGILTRAIAQSVGGEWSYAHDLLPLIAGNTVFTWSTGTGGTIFLLRSNGLRLTDIRQRLTTLHESFRTRFAGNTTVRHTFDRSFTQEIVTRDAAQEADRQETIRGWTVRETNSGDHPLLSAVRGRDIMVTTDRDWLQRSIATDGPPLLTEGRPPAPTTASIPSPLLQQWDEETERQPSWQWLRKGLESTGALWSLARDGQGTILSLTLSPP